jgi:hypothetical protein
MKSIVEQHNGRQRRQVTVKDARLVPVIGRLCRSSLKRLERAYCDQLPAAMLVSHSRFAPGYVIDGFLASIGKDVTVIRIAEALDDPTRFMDAVVRGIGFECEDLNLENLNDVLGLFLRYQKVHRRRTVLVVSDIDAQGENVRGMICEMIEMEVANEFGLMVVLTGPANDLPDPLDPLLESILAKAGERIVLTPFTMSETQEFVRDRFLQPASNGQGNGDVRPNFEFYAIGLIHELSSGVFETVDLLCRKSIEIAASGNKATICTSSVKAAAELLGLMPPAPIEEPEPPVLMPEASEEPARQLIVKVEGEAEKRIRLNGSNLLIGRDRLCDVCVEDVQVSRLHGLFARAADGMHYVDLGSTNGSAVNGEPIRRMVLENKDVVAVGDVRIIYSEKTADEADGVDLDATDTFEIPEHEEFPSINYVGKGVLHREEP